MTPPPLSVGGGGNQGTDLDALEQWNDSKDGDDPILYCMVDWEKDIFVSHFECTSITYII